MNGSSEARRVVDIDWATWCPSDIAVLVVIVVGEETLLIHKKRGLGAGKISAAGGRVDPGEEAVDAAVREVQEELGVTPVAPAHCGELRFQFVDGFSLHVHVFRADGVQGTPIETDEAIPLWVATDRIPYAKMWEDDQVWLPHVIERRHVGGRFLFDGDRMLDHALVVRDTSDPSGQRNATGKVTSTGS